MKIIIPMAGRGTRLRPHSLTVPKPLVSIAGKPIVERLVEDLSATYGGTIEEIAFIIGDFGEQVEEDLKALAIRVGAKGRIFHQHEKLGTAHAILCAQEVMEGNIIVAFADTLFRADFTINPEDEGCIWVKRVDDPSAYGVVQLDDNGVITEFVEKPTEFVSDLAIIGVYYFKDADYLRRELQYLVDNDIKERGEYQLTNALENMKQKGTKFKTQTIEEWLDCGNKNAVVYANQRILDFKNDARYMGNSVKTSNALVIQPCFIGDDAEIHNSVVGPYVTIGKGAKIENSIISKSIVQDFSTVSNVVIENSMLGNYVEYIAKKTELSLGDFSKYHQ